MQTQAGKHIFDRTDAFFGLQPYRKPVRTPLRRLRTRGKSELVSESADKALRNFGKVHLVPQFLPHRGYAFRRVAAGRDEPKSVELSIDVESHAVKGHPFAHGHANTGYFAVIDPHSRPVNAQLRLKPVAAQNGSYGGQQFFHIQMQIFFTQKNDGIGHQLPWPVKSGHTAALYPKKPHALLPEVFLACMQVLGQTATSHRDDRIVLQQQQGVASDALDAGIHAAFLKIQSLAVFNAAKIENFQRQRTSGLGRIIVRQGLCKRHDASSLKNGCSGRLAALPLQGCGGTELRLRGVILFWAGTEPSPRRPVPRQLRFRRRPGVRGSPWQIHAPYIRAAWPALPRQ